MTDIPAPPVPAECDLRGMLFMPLDVQRLLDSDLFVTASGDEFKAAVALWCKSWSQVPAASLPDDERILAAYSGAGTKWKKVRGVALRGWKKASDGRLYHHVVAEKANEAWAARIAQRARTEAARQAREAARAASDRRRVSSVTDSVTEQSHGLSQTPLQHPRDRDSKGTGTGTVNNNTTAAAAAVVLSAREATTTAPPWQDFIRDRMAEDDSESTQGAIPATLGQDRPRNNPEHACCDDRGSRRREMAEDNQAKLDAMDAQLARETMTRCEVQAINRVVNPLDWLMSHPKCFAKDQDERRAWGALIQRYADHGPEGMDALHEIYGHAVAEQAKHGRQRIFLSWFVEFADRHTDWEDAPCA